MTGQAKRLRFMANQSARLPRCSRIHAAPQVAETFVCDVPSRHDPVFAPVAGSRDTGCAIDLRHHNGAGVETLLASAGMVPGDLSRIYLAGGFGLHLKPENALAIGLLPPISLEKMQVVGNSALGGAHLALMDRSLWHGLEAMRDIYTVVELNLDPDFEDHYIGHLALP